MNSRALQIWGVLQASMKSARLPDKIMLPVLGRPMLSHNIERLRRSVTIAGIVVATSTDPADEAIALLCEQEGVPVFRGSEDDVLDRTYRCATERGWAVFAKFTADNPLIHPAVVDEVIRRHLEDPDRYDDVSNNHPPTSQDGQEVEVIRTSALETAWADQPFQREYVTPFIWDQPSGFRLANVAREDDRWYGRYRWTLDYPEDYEFMRLVYEALYPQRPSFDTADLMTILRERPDIAATNRDRAGYIWYREHADSLMTIQGTDHIKDRSEP